MLRCLERPLNLPAYQHSFHLSSIPSSFLPLSHAHFLFRWQLFFTEVKTKAEEGAVICNVSVRGRGTTKTRKERDWYEYVKILGKKRHSAPHKTKHILCEFLIKQIEKMLLLSSLWETEVMSLYQHKQTPLCLWHICLGSNLFSPQDTHMLRGPIKAAYQWTTQEFYTNLKKRGRGGAGLDWKTQSRAYIVTRGKI